MWKSTSGLGYAWSAQNLIFTQVKTFDDILVYHAASTAASEDNNVPMNPDPRSFDALMRRRPPRPLDLASDARTGLD